ncbi:MAG: cytidine deaminase [Bacteroidetes bacterium]|nr:cytidine deaminase [Bacteroidota bacterium]
MAIKKRDVVSSFTVYDSAAELAAGDAVLLQKSVSELQHSYSPYSGFKVAATVLLANGEVLTGTNQENASYPVCMCAEGTVLGAVSSLYPGVAVLKMAVTVKSSQQSIAHPVAPCGLCRQRLLEYENRFQQNIKVIMAGESGEVLVADTVKDLLPLYFSGSDL